MNDRVPPWFDKEESEGQSMCALEATSNTDHDCLRALLAQTTFRKHRLRQLVHSILVREEAAIAATAATKADGGAAATDEALAMVSMDRVLRHYLTLRKETCSGFQGLWSASVDAWDDEVPLRIRKDFAGCNFGLKSLQLSRV